ncbi:CD209 antigen-like protein C [Latimeria chalumnae]|uniref:C-type lectin domain-containing protein n=1 Tax=Latimeria chalumnae TaxID=7897 RepID=M3XIU7_LATCH|nr:PREDICTED: CD209 antigen-like protein C [Latimeria chalumnae]|eukprot:XP_014350054.1 PREDICTED: CD209 antigen-like protein C [Latimeria chalumnae]
MPPAENVNAEKGKPVEGKTCRSNWDMIVLTVFCCLSLTTTFAVKLHYENLREKIANLTNQMELCIKTIQADKVYRWECCPRDWLWFRGSCYYFSNDEMNWNQSKENCKSMDSHLVIITSKEEQDFIEKQLKKVYWIGLSDQEREGVWKLVVGTSLNNSTIFWKKGQPNNQKKEDCATMGGLGRKIILKWMDHSCSFKYSRICEKAASYL